MNWLVENSETCFGLFNLLMVVLVDVDALPILVMIMGSITTTGHCGVLRF